MLLFSIDTIDSYFKPCYTHLNNKSYSLQNIIIAQIFFRIVMIKRQGHWFNFCLFFFFWGGGGVAFIQGRRLHEGGIYYKIQKKLHFYISTSMISSSSIRKTVLSASSTSESVIRYSHFEGIWWWGRVSCCSGLQIMVGFHLCLSIGQKYL